jgi:hypothetical protein
MRVSKCINCINLCYVNLHRLSLTVCWGSRWVMPLPHQLIKVYKDKQNEEYDRIWQGLQK